MIPAARPDNQFPDALPDDAFKSVFEFLTGDKGALTLQGDDRAVIATAAVCRKWRDDAGLSNERKESSTRLHQRIRLQNIHRQMGEREYPLQMRQLFQNCNSPIWRLPVLDLGDRMGGSDYIDFIQPEEMNHPVMQFKDRYGRPGIALDIQAASPGPFQRREISRIASGMRSAIQHRNLDNLDHHIRKAGRLLLNWGQSPRVVLALFKRDIPPSHSTRWTFGWGNSNDIIERLYKSRHNANGHVDAGIETCPTCPFEGDEPGGTVIQDLLTNQDPDFRLPGHNQNQVAARRGFSQRAIVVTALAAVVLAYLVNYYFASERS